MVEIRRKANATSAIERGFTLIEIVIALFILGTSLVTLLGLQSAILERTNRDQNRLNAMLFMRRVLANIETSNSEVDVGNQSGTFAELLELSQDDPDYDKALSIDGSIEIQFWPLPQNPQALKQVIVRASWGPDALDSFILYYFLPNDEAFDAELADETDTEDLDDDSEE
ncbi:MAG: prepilin-type N-terminal cleavage/methylation domain-containing protein [Bdellovibrionales bacterium]|nr:prepilin-type N-terminal cleavage/methylation domain-containing protein [Bdellovibrionales bacterium]